MHSFVIQLAKKPVAKEDYIRKAYLKETGFIPWMTDGVEDTDSPTFPELTLISREGYLDFLKELTSTRWKGITVDEETQTLTITDKKEYFKEQYSEFQKALKELTDASFDDFVCGLDAVDELDRAYDDDHYVYVVFMDEPYYEEGEEKPDVVPLIPTLYTFHDFLRCFEDGSLFYIGNIINYHY